MRTNIIIDDNLIEKWWEIKQEAAKLNMKIANYLIFCHDIRKKSKNKEKLIKILNHPLSKGKNKINPIKATKCMWKI